MLLFIRPDISEGRELRGFLADLFGSQIWRSDLPELPELDNLFAPQGAIEAAQDPGSRSVWSRANLVFSQRFNLWRDRGNFGNL